MLTPHPCRPGRRTRRRVPVRRPGRFLRQGEIAAAIAAVHAASAPPAGIVITHEHRDHWTPENVTAIREAALGIPILTTQATAETLAEAGIDGARVVLPGDRITAGPFELEFYGGRHELLHSSIPVIENVGVRIDDTLAWGGDSLVHPPFRADALGIPIGSPWSNLAQVLDFTLNAAPRRAYLTHDGILSERGLGLFTQRVRACLEQAGGELIRLPHVVKDPGARLEL
ncbi:MBL fold metallo-hydrolase [Leucobacter soli]|uniref:MBL fold metallo-hydrolase n=1 Tax=Leucobacter soli TaxID=2812850 RepID=UPI00360F55F1